MPFGLVNATATFNTMMGKLLHNMQHADSFVDDILGHTQNWESHIMTLRELFGRMRETNLAIRPTKCKLGYMNLDFVGHKVGQNVVQPNPDRVSEIQNAKRPETKKQVRSFLGLVGFYRKYIANFAETATPLTNLTTKGSPNQVEWEAQHQVAFDSLKSQIVKQPILHIPHFDLGFILQTDASDSGI